MGTLISIPGAPRDEIWMCSGSYSGVTQAYLSSREKGLKPFRCAARHRTGRRRRRPWVPAADQAETKLGSEPSNPHTGPTSRAVHRAMCNRNRPPAPTPGLLIKPCPLLGIGTQTHSRHTHSQAKGSKCTTCVRHSIPPRSVPGVAPDAPPSASPLAVRARCSVRGPTRPLLKTCSGTRYHPRCIRSLLTECIIDRLEP